MPKLTSFLPAVALTLALGGALTACGGDDSPAKADDPAAGAKGTPCTYSSDGQPPAKEVNPPSSTATTTGQVTGTVTTNLGDLDITLDADNTPCTVNSFISLAKQGYFDATSCHRLTTRGIYVLQCGDPTGTGSGGPGYSFKDELTGKESYPSGTLAMANAGPDTNGSQFFIVYADTPLPPSYTVFGSVGPDGVALIKKVAKAGTNNANGLGDGAPNKSVEIQSVSIG